MEVVPFGSTILVELLSNQELTSSLIKLSGKQGGGQEKGNANQGYIVALGNGLPADVTLAVGDRVLINGGFIPVPEVDGVPEGRVRGLVEYHSVKAKLAEPTPLLGDFPTPDPNVLLA